ncbi:MAG TPA: hypothetical protein IAC52_01095 [Candidatus Enteromonas pullicola]|uniref:Uncharacterized protein n=1 Tax=Candidatus Alloenteromonas pullicola TaxID=2840784 RepID=A0A9D1LN62_9FIRM|nr:hypothetical protein [Candidatus Enteromonas pullicola]
MAYKFGMILSLFFLVFSFLIAGDVVVVSGLRNQLDALSLAVSYKLSVDGYFSDEVKALVEEDGAYFANVSDEMPAFGQLVSFDLCVDYDPMIISKGPMTVSVSGAAVVGYIK